MHTLWYLSKVLQVYAVLQLGKIILVFPELCHSCYACSELCPAQALPMQPKKMGELTESKIFTLSKVDWI